MKAFKTKKYFLPGLALACLAPLVSQNAQAAATFSNYATVTYTIDTITSSSNPGNFSGLGITGWFDLVPGQDFSTISGEGSVTPHLVGVGSTTLSPAVDSSYSRTFQLDGVANNGGLVEANYLAGLGLTFKNDSTVSYDIGLTLSYEISSNAGGDNAFTDVTLNYYNEDGSFSNFASPDYIQASTAVFGTAFLQNSRAFSLTLAPDGSETLYVDAGITGTLQASPVPLPSAIWLFGSALLAIPGIKKSKNDSISL